MTTPRPLRPVHAANAPRNARRPARKIAAGGALAFLVAGVTLAGGAQWTAHQVRSAMAGMGVQVADVSVDPLSGVMTLESVAASQDGLRIAIGSITTQGGFALSTAAEAAGAITLNDIEIGGKSLTLRIPRMDVAGDNLDEARLRAIFDKTSKTPLAQRLSDIAISRATIPELILLLNDGDNEIRYVWNEVAITDLKNGAAGAVTANKGQFTSRAAGKAVNGAVGATTLDQVNLALVARLYTEAAANDADRKLQPAYGAFSSADITVKSDDADIAIKNISGNDLQARLLDRPLLEQVKLIGDVKDPEELKPEARAAYFNMVAELMEAFSLGSVSVSGVSFDIAANSDDEDEDETKKVGDDKAAKDTTGAPERIKGEIATISFASEPAKGGLKMAGFKVVPAEGDMISLAEANIGGFGGNTLAKIFRDYAEAAKSGKDVDSAPSLGAVAGDFGLKDLNVNVASDSSPDTRVKFSLQSYSGAYSDPVNGVPSNIKTSLDHLIIDLPQAKPDADDDSSVNATVSKLRDMGYEKIDLSAKFDGKWDAATQQLQIGGFSIGAADMGGLTLSGLLGNVSKDLFASDTDKTQEILMASRLKSLSLDITDSGFAQRFAQLQGKEQGGDAGQVRTGWAALAQLLLPSFVGTSDGAKALTSALGDFIRKSGTLDINITSKNPDGEVVSELAAAALSGNPDALFSQIDLKAVAK